MTDENERTEFYSVDDIRAAFKAHARPDDWGVESFYEDGLINALRGRYGCTHRFPDGTRCTLSDEAHASVPGLSKTHNRPSIPPAACGRTHPGSCAWVGPDEDRTCLQPEPVIPPGGESRG